MFAGAAVAMVAAWNKTVWPFDLVVTGEARRWESALEQIVGPQWIRTMTVSSDGELLDVVQAGVADAAVLDEAAPWRPNVLQLLRIIRRLDAVLPVVVLTAHTDRRWLEAALRLTAFSVVVKPLALEELLRQIHRMMHRVDQMLRGDLDE